jgi:putative transcriptional regulator
MSIQHHPDAALLSAFAAGALDGGQHVALATHLFACAHCRNFARMMERVGGTLLIDLPPESMASDAFATIEARLGESSPARPAEPSSPGLEIEIPGLPKLVRGYRFGDWKWVAPSIHARPIELPIPSETRVFLLKSGPGTRMLEHSHTGVEMTCVLAGGFSQEQGHYGPGDFDIGDESVDHHPIIDSDRECICLVAMQGELRFGGLIGRLIQPFVRL